MSLWWGWPLSQWSFQVLVGQSSGWPDLLWLLMASQTVRLEDSHRSYLASIFVKSNHIKGLWSLKETTGMQVKYIIGCIVLLKLWKFLLYSKFSWKFFKGIKRHRLRRRTAHCVNNCLNCKGKSSREKCVGNHQWISIDISMGAREYFHVTWDKSVMTKFVPETKFFRTKEGKQKEDRLKQMQNKPSGH